MKLLVAIALSAGLIFSSAFAPKLGKRGSGISVVSTRDSVYFVSAPIVRFSQVQTPCVDVAIGDTSFVAELDLGLRGDATLTRDLLDQIADKSFVNKRSVYSWRGKKYIEDVYKVPQMKIGGISFDHPKVQAENKAFPEDAILVKAGHERAPRELGRLGWKLFYHTNLFLDFKNSKIIFADSIDTLKKHGYPMDMFVKTPLLLDRGLVEFEAVSINKPIRCVLDTGATWNIFHMETQKLVPELVWDPKNTIEVRSFQIGGKDFGTLFAHSLPIHLPIKVEAIIGMEFLSDKSVFIDFRKKLLYFSSL